MIRQMLGRCAVGVQNNATLSCFNVGFLRYVCADDYVLLKDLKCGAGAG
jgi:hypothetical protein